MSELKKLLEGIKVEWKSLGEVTNILRGRRLTKKQLSINDIHPVFHGGLEPLGYYANSNRPAESVMIINVGASAGTVGYSDVEFWSSDGCYTIEKSLLLNDRFVYYYLLGEEYYLKSKVRYAGIPTLDAFIIEKIQIPIPCPENPEQSLKIQTEIVRILDALTEETNALTNELDKELQARQKQYEYYREELFKFEGKEVKWKSLMETGEIKRGVAFTKKQAVLGNFPVVANAAEPISFHNEFNRDGEFIVIARSGANAGLISYWNEELYLTDAFSIHPNNSVLNTKFVFYYLKIHQREIHLMKRGSGVPHVRASDFEIYKTPVPSLLQQERIIKILDKLDTATQAITGEIKKEKALRKKQYEYYRDLLLTFPKEEA